MNTNSKRIGSIATSVVAVGLIIGGSFGVARAVGQSPAAPAPTSTYEPESVPMTPSPDAVERQAAHEAEKARLAAEAEAARVEAERVAAEAEAARVEAERVAAEQAAAERAARDETFEEAPSEQAEPFAPTLCPEGTVPMDVDAAGNQSNCQASYNQDVVVP